MKKAHILKKQEARFLKRLRPVTEENIDTYPIGNPYKKWGKVEMEKMSEAVKSIVNKTLFQMMREGNLMK